MDCVTEDGTVVLAYASDLTLGSVHVKHSSLLIVDIDGMVVSRQSFIRGMLPEFVRGKWQWRCWPLSIQGSWTPVVPTAAPISLYGSGPWRNVSWQCLAPRAKVWMSTKGWRLEGTGYMECLTMNLEPWSLPLDSLHWGRFHADNGRALTWIVWEGDHPLSIMLENGKPISLPGGIKTRPSGERLDFAGCSLDLSCERVLRSGDISETVLTRSPMVLRRLLPDSILHLKETKWGGPASLVAPGLGAPENGYAIHEVVRFKP